MNSTLASEIAELAVSLAKTQTSGRIQQDAELAGTLLQIIQKEVQAYQDHTGQVLNPDLIKASKPKTESGQTGRTSIRNPEFEVRPFLFSERAGIGR